MEKSKNLSVLILAAGKGKRMKSSKPKVLHQILSKPMLYYILNSVYGLCPLNVVVVVGHQKNLVRKYLKDNYPQALTIEQNPQLGTAHAVKCAASLKREMGSLVLVLSGDCPLILKDTLKQLVARMTSTGSSAAILSTEVEDPTGYGRIIKDSRGKVLKVVEHNDTTPRQQSINEINTSIYCFDRDKLFDKIEEVGSDNSQKEYYLTDVIEKMVNSGQKVTTYKLQDSVQVLGVNDRAQLADAEKVIRQRINYRLSLQGVSIKDPAQTYIQDTVTIGIDTVIEPCCFIEGNTSIGTGCRIGPFTQIKDASIGKNTTITNSVIEGSLVGEHNYIGPFSYLGPGVVTSSHQSCKSYYNLGSGDSELVKGKRKS